MGFISSVVLLYLKNWMIPNMCIIKGLIETFLSVMKYVLSSIHTGLF